ncbi:MoxR family ATPase [Maribrevibacterium harenarium]|uniref:MoxR family ATPase n=1 Tax=Maribrevibacterium harenarium TaxID=2589817 RepID=A0A501WR56_9GAMM|nr:MoxR family ATPase [Maribrevibacterium harenarium]TPE51312.1 MoxR family ATPase [Maribrevibacterium harenarium]
MDTAIDLLKEQLSRAIVGQEDLIQEMLIALIARGHILLEGPPGIAKTTAAKALAGAIDAEFQRIQFTPDLLPADVTGSEIYQQDQAKFQFSPGPIMHDIVLADEVNRAPAKVQSALLEAMGERQVTVGSQSYALSPIFFVIATQNPIEQEGTYSLPEAQLDRFVMKIKVDYPDAQTELAVMRLVRQQDQYAQAGAATPTCSVEDILRLQKAALEIYMAESVENYIVHLVMSTRRPQEYFAEHGEEISTLIEYGASPRATLALERCARARAILDGRDFVTPDDVKAVAPAVLRHRILPSFEAEARGYTTDRIIHSLITYLPLV